MKLISSKKALIVEDNEINQLVTSQMLESIGFDIDIAILSCSLSSPFRSHIQCLYR